DHDMARERGEVLTCDRGARRHHEGGTTAMAVAVPLIARNENRGAACHRAIENRCRDEALPRAWRCDSRKSTNAAAYNTAFLEYPPETFAVLQELVRNQRHGDPRDLVCASNARRCAEFRISTAARCP